MAFKETEAIWKSQAIKDYHSQKLDIGRELQFKWEGTQRTKENENRRNIQIEEASFYCTRASSRGKGRPNSTQQPPS